MRLLPVLLLVTSCGPGWQRKLVPDGTPKVSVARPSMEVDEAAIEIVNQFYADAATEKVKTTDKFTKITFVDSYDKENVVGRCDEWGYSDGTIQRREMTLLRSYWETASAQTRKTLVYHELGHCALGLGHTPEKDQQIMNPTVIPDVYAQTRWSSLVKYEMHSEATGKLSLYDEPCDYGERHGF